MSIDPVQEALRRYRAAAEKFINKVETGRAFSRETYADLRAAIAYHNRIGVTEATPQPSAASNGAVEKGKEL